MPKKIVHVRDVFPKITHANSRKRLHYAMRLYTQQQVSNTCDGVSLSFIFLQFVINILLIALEGIKLVLCLDM